MDLSGKSAVIFDVDGVLVDSEPLSCGALRQILNEEHNVDTGDDFSPVLGTSNAHAIKYYLSGASIAYTDDEINRLVDIKAERYIQLASQQLKGFAHCEQFIQKLLDSGKKICVASSGSLEKIRFSLDKVNLLQYFDLLNSSEEVKNGKPAPDLFELALKRLDEPAGQCVVIEDSLMGIEAARSAGIEVLGFVGSFSKEALEEAGASVFHSYDELFAKIKD